MGKVSRGEQVAQVRNLAGQEGGSAAIRMMLRSSGSVVE